MPEDGQRPQPGAPGGPPPPGGSWEQPDPVPGADAGADAGAGYPPPPPSRPQPSYPPPGSSGPSPADAGGDAGGPAAWHGGAGPGPSPDGPGNAPAGGGPWRPVPPGSGAPSDRLGGRLLAVRPLAVSDILDGAFRGWRATFLPAALLVVILIGPLQLLLNLALTLIAPELGAGGFGDLFADLDEPPETFEVPGTFFGVTFVGGVLGFLITLVVSAAVVSLVLQVDRGEQPETGASVREAGRVLGTTLGASLLLIVGGTLVAFVAMLVFGLLVVVQPVVGLLFAFLVLLPVGVILGAAFYGMTSMVVPIAVIERRGVLATIGRSFWVLRHRFWRVVGISLLVGLIVGIVGLVFQVPFSIAAFFLGPVGWVSESIGQILAQVISIPVTVIAIMLVYLDARVRLEGLDLQLRARWFGQP